MIGFVRAFLVLLILALASGPVRAQERIVDFTSDIAIAGDGVLTVRETIIVEAEGNRIQRGIFRDFPTEYRDSAGTRVRVRFDVQEVRRDGRPEPYAIETIANGMRVRIGDPEIFLDPGQHRYEIVYETDRQIGFFPDHDEIYWNVTGNAWNFAIDRAEAVIRLPPGATVLEQDFYTGPEGASGKDATAAVEGAIVRFATTRGLGPREGLTVAVGFSKGAVTPPTASQLFADFLRDNASIGAALLGLIALGAFYFSAWQRVGRDPERGIIVPLFAPPKGFSAADVRFVNRMGYDRKAFAAALIAMAVKGYLTISEDRHIYTLIRTGKSEDEAGLDAAERALALALFAGSNEIALKNTNHATVGRAVRALSGALAAKDEGVYFVTNRLWFFGGLAILIVSGLLAMALSDDPNADLPIPPLALAAILAQAVLAALFYRLLKAPTLAGAKIRDQITGFRMFLTTAEKHRLEILHPPNVTPEVFEKFLPFAIALDAENAWSRKFESEAAQAGVAQTAYTPRWYSGPSFRRLGMRGFTSGLGSAIAGATAAAATPPGRASGLGGRGRSGGGGGGGGGGGW